MKNHFALLKIACDLTSALSSKDRYQRLVDTVRSILHADCCTLMRIEGNELVPLASRGLVPEILKRRFSIDAHPRLKELVSKDAPHVFPSHCNLPDPFDGFLEADPSASLTVHSCMGSPLMAEGRVIGLLTADSLQEDAFHRFDPEELQYLGVLAGATLHTGELIEKLEHQSELQTDLVQDFIEQERQRGRQIIGDSLSMEELKREMKMVADLDAPVLITGETGTGKELVARQIHQMSSRSTKPMIYVNCAALPESVAESELFGHEKGSFTGADQMRAGKFEVADGGSLFLDELGELPLSIQAKLLRALQEGEVQRVGSDELKRVDVRIITATNRDLEKEVLAKRFRADLFHRINAFTLNVPPLRQRSSDIPLLAGFFLDQLQHQLNLKSIRLDHSARQALMEYPWPGNVREFENILFRAAAKSRSKNLRHEELLLTSSDFHLEKGEEHMNDTTTTFQSLQIEHDFISLNLREATNTFQKRMIVSAVERQNNNWAAAARDLGINRSNLHHLAKRLGLR